MTQNNFRKEPVFGEPLTPTEENAVAESNPTTERNKPYVSLHSTQTPGHTFTPIMKRPEPVEQPQAEQMAKSAKEFQFTPTSEEVEQVTSEVEETVLTSSEARIELNEKVEEEIVVKPINEGFTTERVIPNVTATAAGASVAAAATAATVKTDSMLKAKMPAKTRRLLLVALLALALLVLFFLLKPSTPETVEELQSQQGSSLPIEFRPVDEAEAKRAEEQARAEQEAAAKQLQEQEQAALQTQQNVNEPQSSTPAQSEQTVNTQTQSVTEPPVAAKPVENKPVVTQPVVKPQTQGSVVYQPETKSQPKTQPKAERVTTQLQKEVAKVAPKSATEKAPLKAEVEKATVSSMATKTMTVPKGVSLMQVFRDNNLNISDVNAMSKVNNVVSNLKVGERVTVRLDKNNRVVEMSIGSGGKFTRQSNGSYTFK
ncbi:LysM-like peptidoglycan-binding domain-containing protein [Mannheimia granulomatis]|uniref:LysM-like peptidoglycan-binding domain-containing protein n=1 Tax=Mannheimia granulomatis TaxID=85402 RepID=UPI00047B0FBE|nr:LysM-like peptidoglycan-binding domain-containing protein [Mannheimia granulomatis]QLB19591.1 opacity-associated protein A [Mannheimia granulomatis]